MRNLAHLAPVMKKFCQKQLKYPETFQELLLLGVCGCLYNKNWLQSVPITHFQFNKMPHNELAQWMKQNSNWRRKLIV